jgi:hypothetical protein
VPPDLCMHSTVFKWDFGRLNNMQWIGLAKRGEQGVATFLL